MSRLASCTNAPSAGTVKQGSFLIDHGIDMTVRDYRWNATAEGWAYHAAKDPNMAEFLARAESARKVQSVERARLARVESQR
jgi:hypothetical protein